MKLHIVLNTRLKIPNTETIKNSLYAKSTENLEAT